MAYLDFVDMFARKSKRDPDELLQEKPLSFPISTNYRGEKLLDFLSQIVDIDFKNLRVLDIGCAYGGFSIAMAKRGAHVTGIDVSPQFIEYARTNAKGDVELDTRVMDASSSEVRDNFERSEFDLILLNDVLEHIYDTTSLAKNIDYLLNDTGRVYFKVPNGHSPRWAISEGHRKIFGLTLLDPDCWFYLHPQRASIFYRPFEYFPAIFGHFGLGNHLWIDEEKVFERFRKRKFLNQFKEIYEIYRNNPEFDPQLKEYLKHGINRFRNEFLFDWDDLGDAYCRFKYGSYFYSGFFARPDADIGSKTEVMTLPPIGSIAAATPHYSFPELQPPESGLLR